MILTDDQVDYPLIDQPLIIAILSDYDPSTLQSELPGIRDQLGILEATLVPDPDDVLPDEFTQSQSECRSQSLSQSRSEGQSQSVSTEEEDLVRSAQSLELDDHPGRDSEDDTSKARLDPSPPLTALPKGMLAISRQDINRSLGISSSSAASTSTSTSTSTSLSNNGSSKPGKKEKSRGKGNKASSKASSSEDTSPTSVASDVGEGDGNGFVDELELLSTLFPNM